MKKAANSLVMVFTFLALGVFSSLNLAKADDYAQRHIIGFSPDGKYFAFEQFGLHDPGGYAFSDIFIINTKTNLYVKPAPFHFQNENKEAEREKGDSENLKTDAKFISRARAKNLKKAAPLLSKLKIHQNFRIFANRGLTQQTTETSDKIISFVATHTKFGWPEYHLKLESFLLKGPPIKDDPKYYENSPIAGFQVFIAGDEIDEDLKKFKLVGGYAENFKIPLGKEYGYPVCKGPDYGCQHNSSYATRYQFSDAIFSYDRKTIVILIAAFYTGHNNGRARYLAIARPWGEWGKLGVAH